ncbi:hypothetical protein HY256_01435 [Candidatus Sumerlaeota bacterium]|nr:hypothetical protein [Candidatus Sumerlaeota bacterium]
MLGAVGQFLYKGAADHARGGFLTIVLSARGIAGMACYVAVMALFMMGFKKGGSLTVLYPIYATTFIWAAVIAWIAFGQPIRPIHALGMVLLLAGMFLMGL